MATDKTASPKMVPIIASLFLAPLSSFLKFSNGLLVALRLSDSVLNSTKAARLNGVSFGVGSVGSPIRYSSLDIIRLDIHS